MQFKKLTVVAAIGAALAISGCDVEQTEEGSMPDVDVSSEAGQMPEYELVQTQEGEMPDVDVDMESGSLPEYEVNWIDVDVGMTEETVTVPKLKVVMEEETVSVPVIDVTMPNGDDRPKERRTLELEAQVPHAGHEISINKIYALESRIIVVGEVVESDANAQPQNVRISDRVVLNAPDLNVRYYIMGVEPTDSNSADYVYIISENDIPADLNAGVVLYTK